MESCWTCQTGQDWACCARTTASACSRYASAFAASGSADSSAAPKPTTYNGDLANLPAALAPRTQHQRWCCLRWAWRPDQERWDKPPLQASNPHLPAKSNDPATWGSYTNNSYSSPFVLNRQINVESVMFRFLFLIESLQFFSGLFV